MPSRQSAIDKGLQLPPNTLRSTDVLIDIDFQSQLRGGPLMGGEFANTHIARRLRALREFVGLTLAETIEAMRELPNVPWAMFDSASAFCRQKVIAIP